MAHQEIAPRRIKFFPITGLARRRKSSHTPDMRTITTLFLAFLLLLPIATVSRADQTDPRLPDLFAKLESADNVDAAFQIEKRIWVIWTNHKDINIDALMDAGQQRMVPGGYERSLAIFNRIIAKAPDFAEGWNKRATVLYLLGDLEGSVRDIEATLALEPRHFGALAGLGLIYRAIEKPESALRAFEKILEINPQSLGTHLQVKQLRKELKGRKL
jgi:tetratricopeptide (TPR) repeat protein